MGDRDDDNLVFRNTVYDLIWKSLHQHMTCSAITRKRAHFGLSLNEGCCMNDSIEEFTAQSGTLLFVPTDGGSKLFARLFEVTKCPSHRPKMSLAIRRLTLSHDSSCSVPASSASTRRRISSSQAVAASGSEGPSRLASNSAASSARWALRLHHGPLVLLLTLQPQSFWSCFESWISGFGSERC